MAIYIINIFLIGVYAFFAKLYADPIKGVRSRSYAICYFFAALQMLLILALRASSVGTDMLSYIRRFQYVNSVDLRTALDYEYNEKGYTILTRLLGKVSMDTQWFTAVMACISIIPPLVILKKESPMPFFSLLIYITLQYYAFIFSGMRQAVAYALVFWSYKYIREKKLLPYAILIVIACYMHKSALFFAPAYFLSYIKINKTSLTAFAVAMVVFYVFRAQLVQYVINQLYQEYEIASRENVGNWIVMCVIIAILVLIARPKLVEYGDPCDALYTFVLIGVILQLSARVASNGGRIAAYYYVFVTILMPKTAVALKDSKLYTFGIYAVAMALIFIYYVLLQRSGYSIVPYRFFWQ